MTAKHIRQVGTERTWCGLEIEAERFFTGIDHAAANQTADTCRKCTAAVIKRLTGKDS